MKKNCVVCDAEFEGGLRDFKGRLMGGNKLYCSQKCKEIRYTCKVCKKPYDDAGSFRQHIKRCKIKKCVICNVEFPTSRGKKITCGKECSLINSKKSQVTQCPHCDYQGQDSYSLKRHNKRQHSPRTCKVCSNTFYGHDRKSLDICSEDCNFIHRDSVRKIYSQKPEIKEAARITQRKSVAKKKAKDPEWNLVPLIKCTCLICKSTFTNRGKVKFCSKACSKVNKQRYKDNILKRLREATIENMKEITCIVCGKTKLTFHSHTKYCNRKCRRKHEQSQPQYIIRRRIGNGLRRSLHNRGRKIAKNDATFNILPYTKEELISHFESYFTGKNGYSWDNIGDWHIDHIRPIASFNYTTTECEDFKKCWALNNLQPLWAKDNLSKGAKWDEEAEA